MADNEQPSLYQQLGERAGITAVVNRLYDLIGQDDRVNFFFGETGMPRHSLTEFLINTAGGPADPNYVMPDLAAVHQPFNISNEAFDIVAGYLQQAMKENGVSDEANATVMKVVGGTREQIVARPKQAV